MAVIRLICLVGERVIQMVCRFDGVVDYFGNTNEGYDIVCAWHRDPSLSHDFMRMHVPQHMDRSRRVINAACFVCLLYHVLHVTYCTMGKHWSLRPPPHGGRVRSKKIFFYFLAKTKYLKYTMH